MVEFWNLIIANKYVQSLIILVGTFLIAKTGLLIVISRLKKLAKKTKTELDDIIIEKGEGPITLLTILIGIRLAIIPLNIGDGIAGKTLDTLTIIIFTYLGIIFFEMIINVWGSKWASRTKSDVDDQILILVHRFSKITFAVLALIFILGKWGVEIGPLLASLGIAGIAVAFALQNTLGNVMGGISLISDGAYKIGDVIKLESGDLGAVIDIGLRSTRIKTFDNEEIIVPNGQLSSSRIINYAHPNPKARVVINFGVEYGSDVKKVRRIVLDAVKDIEKLKEPVARVEFTEMGESALLFTLKFWVGSYTKRYNAKLEATEKVYNALNKAGIGIPFPTRTVYVKK